MTAITEPFRKLTTDMPRRRLLCRGVYGAESTAGDSKGASDVIEVLSVDIAGALDVAEGGDGEATRLP